MTGTVMSDSVEFAVDAGLAAKLAAVLRTGNLKGGHLDRALAELARVDGDAVFAELIHLLTHLRLAPQVAEDLWRRSAEHRRTMEARLGAEVDPRVALVSYLVDVTPMLDNPKVVEMAMFDQTRERAYRDALTGLRNYRFFAECLTQEIAAAEQNDAPVSLILIDLDNFKALNDRHGHETGNNALASVARALTASVRPSDVLARFGGEEFAVVLPATPKEGAMLVADKVRRAVEACSFPSEVGAALNGLTISVGVATAPADAGSSEDLVRCADAALYAAKSSGKNRSRAYGNSLRSFHRFPVALQGTFAVGVTDRRPLTTVNVSPRGMLIRTDEKLSVGAVIDARLVLPTSCNEVRVLGCVVSSSAEGEGSYETAIRLVEIAGVGRQQLKEYLKASAGREEA